MAESSTTTAAHKRRKPRHVRRATSPLLWGWNQPVLKDSDSEEVVTDQILPILPEPAFIPREQKHDKIAAAEEANPRVPSCGIWAYPDEDLQEAFRNSYRTVKRRSCHDLPLGSRRSPCIASSPLLPIYRDRDRMYDLRAQHQKSEGRKLLLRFLCFPPLLLLLGHGLADGFLQWQTANGVMAFGHAERKHALFLGYGIFLASAIFAIFACTLPYFCKFDFLLVVLYRINADIARY